MPPPSPGHSQRHFDGKDHHSINHCKTAGYGLFYCESRISLALLHSTLAPYFHFKPYWYPCTPTESVSIGLWQSCDCGFSKKQRRRAMEDGDIVIRTLCQCSWWWCLQYINYNERVGRPYHLTSTHSFSKLTLSFNWSSGSHPQIHIDPVPHGRSVTW